MRLQLKGTEEIYLGIRYVGREEKVSEKEHAPGVSLTRAIISDQSPTSLRPKGTHHTIDITSRTRSPRVLRCIDAMRPWL